MKKRIYIILGYIFFALGIFGYYMPVIPGTIFMVISAYFFMNSSEKLYKKITENQFYGKSVKQYVENGIIPLKMKVIILLSMWIATLITVYVTPAMKIPLGIEFFDTEIVFNFKLFGIILAIIGTIVILKAKNK